MAISECVQEIKIDIFAKQNEIIHLQSDAINGLLELIALHDDIDDADFSSIRAKIDKAAEMQAEMNF